MNATDLLFLKYLLLIFFANGFPILARHIPFIGFLKIPLDNGRILKFDQRPVFGRTKTWRGLVSSLLLTPLLAYVIGLPPVTGFVIAILAMAGDLLSSFIKRRMNIVSSGKATGLDQIPESAFPFAYLYFASEISSGLAITGVFIFLISEPVISTILYSAGIRKRPY